MVFKCQQSIPGARPGESVSGLPGSKGRGKRRESSQELGRASPLPTSLHGLMGQAQHNPASGEAAPHAVEAVGCPHSTRRTGEPSAGGRRTRLDAACTGNSDRECQTGDTESTFLRAIASKAKREKQHRFTALYRHLNEGMLTACWPALNQRAASGVDRVSPRQYGQRLAENIRALVRRLREGRYRAPCVRRRYIPKGKGKLRPLGIPTTEDKLVQNAVARLLEAIYEADFLPCSFGYRRGVAIHAAVKELDRSLWFGSYRYVVEADIKGFFDHLDHAWLLRMLSERIADRSLLRLIAKWLRAGVLEEDGRLIHPESGTPQGGVISPVLANVYLHYALDLWFEKVVRPRCRGGAKLIRYADDFVVLFEREADAQAFYAQLGTRLGKFGLEISAAKTRIVRFDRLRREGQFEFLGFTFRWQRNRQGKTVLARVTARKKLHGALQRFREWFRANRHERLPLLMRAYAAKLRGHYAYYGLRGNGHRLYSYYEQTRRVAHRWLNRRSQKCSYDWASFARLLRRHCIPEPRILPERLHQAELFLT